MAAIITLPFTCLPNIIANYFSGRLSTNILLLLILIESYEIFKYKSKINKRLLCFILIFVLWNIISELFNILNFGYWDFLYLTNIEKLDSINIFSIEKEKFYVMFYLLRNIAKILLNYITCFGLVYSIWHIYSNNWEKAFNDIKYSLMILFSMMGIYSFVEMLWIKFDLIIARNFLTFINPFFFEPASKSGWWPPLLWDNQLRSLCVEPSFFGILASLITPLLWYKILKNTNFVTCFFTFYFSVMIFMTNARTAILLLIGEVIILFLLNFLYTSKEILKKSFIIFITILTAFMTNILIEKGAVEKLENNFISKIYTIKIINGSNITEINNNTQFEKSKKNKVFSKIDNKSINANNEILGYLDKNIYSVVQKNQRSNATRLNIMKTHINMGNDNILLGKGYNTYIPYMERYLPNDINNDKELNGFIKDIHNKGFIKAGYPTVNQFTFIYATSGLIGLIIFLIPIFYVVIYLKKLYKYVEGSIFIFLVCAFAASVVAMFSAEAFYSYYLLLGLIYLLIENYNKHKFENLNVNFNY